jgi:hypothetical protein
MTKTDLKYEPGSFAGPFDEAEVHDFEEDRHLGEQPWIKFDKSYIAHLQEFHGGIPSKRCFLAASGHERLIEQFMNFTKTGHPLEDYNVEVAWSAVDDRLGEYLMPFAELFAGDMLCFDYSDYQSGARPKIVVWLHEESWEDTPATDFVAPNFDAFLEMLFVPKED